MCVAMQHATTTDTDQLTDWKPVADKLKLKQRAFWRAVHEDGLPYYKLNGRVLRFRWSEVERWLCSHQRGMN